MITTTVTTASKVVPIIIKAAKIGMHLLPVAAAAEPYVKEAVHKKHNENNARRKAKTASRKA